MKTNKKFKKKNKKFKCEFCDKEFTRKNNRDTHQETYCTSNPNSKRSLEDNSTEPFIGNHMDTKEEILSETPILTPQIDEDIEYLKYFYKGKKEGNVYLRMNEAEELFRIFKNKINSKMQLNVRCHLNRRYVYIVLFKYIRKIEKK